MFRMPDRMRTLVFVIHSLNPWGGHERSTLEIIRRITRIFSGTQIISYSIEDSPDRQNQWGGYDFLKIRPYLRRPAVVLIGYFLVASLFKILGQKIFGKRPILVHATGACSWGSDVIQVQFLNASWRKKKASYQDLNLFKNPAARQARGLRVWVLDFYHESLLRINIVLEKLIYRSGKTYIVLSEQLKNELLEEFELSAKVHVIYHGVDTQVFSPSASDRSRLRTSLKISEQEILILFVGEYERKGLAVVMQVMARLPERLKGKVKLLAVGGGDQQGFLEYARSLGIQSDVQFLGHQKNIAEFYRAADIFLLPTYYEPFGLVVLEAMASSVPVVVSAQAGASELIQHQKSGYKILDPANIDEILNLLVPLCEDLGLRQRVGKEGREVALTRSWDQVAKEYEEVLKPLLHRRNE